ncbi:MAG: type II toxin-antitoxin system prevent-host-death family antitoxin [Spirochaetales bacterium]|nr:type II toxin-antitoxin system prevent-host-death family antitoxin [Spirochaetales bacterium]
MVNSITANELKIKGISILDKITSEQNEAIITVRGKSKYVVLPIEEYNYLRECELEAAIVESCNDLKNGIYTTGSVDDHIKRIENA